MTLGEQLAGARIVRYDSWSGLTMAYFGGHGVHAYDEEGNELAYWNVGDFALGDASDDEVIESMDERMEDQDYIDFS